MITMSSQALQKRNRKSVDDKNSVESKLMEELERIKAKVGMGHDLKLKWAPSLASDKHGEVRGNVILIYDEELEDALQTLRHEFIDYNITKEVLEPAVQYINMQKSLIESLLYRRKESLVDRLSKLL